MIILAAGQGVRLRPLTDTRPKCLVKVVGKPLLDWQLAVARSEGISDITIVRGYLREMVDRPGVSYFDNLEYRTTNMVETLWCAESVFGNGFVVSYGDIVYESRVLRKLLSADHPISVVVDQGWRSYWEKRFTNVLDDAETLEVNESGKITSIGQEPSCISEIQGQYIGLTSFREDGVKALRQT